VTFAGLSQMLVTKTSAKAVMAVGMSLIGGGIIWAAQIPVHDQFWAHLVGPFFVAGAGTAFAFIPVSIAALAGVGERDAGVASGLLNTSQQIGGAIGVAVASTVAASRADTLAHLGYGTAAALTGGFSQALWVCGLVGVAAVPLTFVLVRRQELAPALAASLGKEAPALVPSDR
jgi:MFS family permease